MATGCCFFFSDYHRVWNEITGFGQNLDELGWGEGQRPFEVRLSSSRWGLETRRCSLSWLKTRQTDSWVPVRWRLETRAENLAPSFASVKNIKQQRLPSEYSLFSFARNISLSRRTVTDLFFPWRLRNKKTSFLSILPKIEWQNTPGLLPFALKCTLVFTFPSKLLHYKQTARFVWRRMGEVCVFNPGVFTWSGSVNTRVTMWRMSSVYTSSTRKKEFAVLNVTAPEYCGNTRVPARSVIFLSERAGPFLWIWCKFPCV